MVAIYVAMHGRILMHELGHFFAAKAVGLRQYKLQVGDGPLIWSRLFSSGVLFEWRMFARGGWVLALPGSDRKLRLRQLMFVAAGPLVDVLLIFVLFRGLTIAFGSLTAAFGYGVVGIVTFTMFWWTVISAVSGLIPHQVDIGSRRLWTDGYWILRLCVGRSGFMENRLFCFDTAEALSLLEGEDVNRSHTAEFPPSNGSHAEAVFREQRRLLTSRLLKNS